jgi:hypothetical protein
VSHLVAWGPRRAQIPIRGKLLDTIATLRASGRLAWVALYGLWFAAVAIVATRFKPRVATALIVGAVALQLADISPRYVSMRDYFADRFVATPAKRASPLVSPFWPEAAKHTGRSMAPVNMARLRGSRCTRPTTAWRSTPASSRGCRSRASTRRTA